MGTLISSLNQNGIHPGRARQRLDHLLCIARQHHLRVLLSSHNPTLLDALEKRNLPSHTYRKESALEAETLIKAYYHPALARLHATLQPQRQA